MFAFATALDQKPPYLNLVFVFALQSVAAGINNLSAQVTLVRQRFPKLDGLSSLSIVLPLVAFLAFGGLFVLANPDAVSFFGEHLTEFFTNLSEWFVRTALRPTELLFWVFVALVTSGLMRPLQHLRELFEIRHDTPPVAARGASEESPLYNAVRNTLLTVIILFAGYLTFEFKSLWFRSFPEGFYYAGYAHQGAAWLTIALGLSTVTLSLVFSGKTVNDPRLAKLRRLAWIWSVQNLILAVAVYNRLHIYVNFNGMTKMRVIGLFGTTLVVVGFLLVVWKIAKFRDFAWLLRRQLWAFLIAIYLYSLTPVDGISASYNVRQVQEGNLAACMQLGVHRLDLEGKVAMLPLLESTDPNIRRGVAALIAKQANDVAKKEKRRPELGWTATQFGRRRAHDRMQKAKAKWDLFANDHERDDAIEEFREFAYQWY